MPVSTECVAALLSFRYPSFKIGQVQVQFELQVCMISDQHCMTQSSITTYYSHFKSQNSVSTNTYLT